MRGCGSGVVNLLHNKVHVWLHVILLYYSIQATQMWTTVYTLNCIIRTQQTSKKEIYLSKHIPVTRLIKKNVFFEICCSDDFLLKNLFQCICCYSWRNKRDFISEHLCIYVHTEQKTMKIRWQQLWHSDHQLEEIPKLPSVVTWMHAQTF